MGDALHHHGNLQEKYGEFHTSSWKSARKLWGMPYIIMEIYRKSIGNYGESW